MQRTNVLWVVRHAAAEHTVGVPDFRRSLRPKGRKQAKRMERWLGTQAQPPGTIVSSAARRAVETAQHVVRGFGLSDDDLITCRALYGAGPGTLIEALRRLPSGTGNAALVGHNPGASDLVRVLIGSWIGDLPTCGIAVLTFQAPWGDLGPGTAELELAATPDSFRER
ncbi:MAG: histidine phosphatase family protein [Gammaproteobacteria bacterium]|nr:histidine phosphatase family protein [Gammaproteobacteria bacterium]